MVMPLALTFIISVLLRKRDRASSSRQKISQERKERARRLGRQEVPALVDEFEPGAGNFLCKFRRAGMRAHRVVAAGNDHCETGNLRQHMQHVGARQCAEGKTETDRVVSEITTEIG